MQDTHDNTADSFLLNESGHLLHDTSEHYESNYDPTNVSRGSMTWRTLPPLAAPTDQGHLNPPSSFHVFPMHPDAQRAGPIGTAPTVPFAHDALAAHAVHQSTPGSSTDRAQSVGVSPVPSGHQQPPRTFHCPLKQQTGCEEVFSRQFDADRHARTTRAHSAPVEAEATGATAGPRIVCDQCDKSFARKDNPEEQDQRLIPVFFVQNQNGKRMSQQIRGRAAQETLGLKESNNSVFTFAEIEPLSPNAWLEEWARIEAHLKAKQADQRPTLSVSPSTQQQPAKKLFSCSQCEKTFTRGYDVQRHSKSIHEATAIPSKQA